MEPTIAIVTSIALGAAALAGKEIVSGVVKDAYCKLKTLLADRYSKLSIEKVENEPQSKEHRALVEKELVASGAATDNDVVAAARDLLGLIQQHVPKAAAIIGVDLKDIEGANLRLAEIVSSGSGVVVRGGKLTGDIVITGVKAGTPPKDA
jgi:hypothetical protein